jgi:hypothetical protein
LLVAAKIIHHPGLTESLLACMDIRACHILEYFGRPAGAVPFLDTVLGTSSCDNATGTNTQCRVHFFTFGVCVCVSVVCRALNERVSSNEKVALSCVITANWHGNAAGAWKCKRTGLQWNMLERSAQHANTIRRYDHTFDQNDFCRQNQKGNFQRPPNPKIIQT